MGCSSEEYNIRISDKMNQRFKNHNIGTWYLSNKKVGIWNRHCWHIPHPYFRLALENTPSNKHGTNMIFYRSNIYCKRDNSINDQPQVCNWCDKETFHPQGPWDTAIYIWCNCKFCEIRRIRIRDSSHRKLLFLYWYRLVLIFNCQCMPIRMCPGILQERTCHL